MTMINFIDFKEEENAKRTFMHECFLMQKLPACLHIHIALHDDLKKFSCRTRKLINNSLLKLNRGN
jgi:hypothetical protein